MDDNRPQIKPMKIILIEDEAKDCRDFMDYCNTRNDVDLVEVTGRADEGMRLVKFKMPEAVIVDLELCYGSGSGYQFLNDFYNTEFNIRPIVVITTRNRNSDIHSQLHDEYSIESIFYKRQHGYCPKMVIDHLLFFRKNFLKRQSGINHDMKSPETPEEIKLRIMARIKSELNNLGISIKYKGRRTAEDGIYMLLTKNYGDSERVFNDLAKKYNTPYHNITRNIQNAIDKVWNNPDNTENLLIHFQSPISSEKGTPTPTELIHYYADKIRADL